MDAPRIDAPVGIDAPVLPDAPVVPIPDAGPPPEAIVWPTGIRAYDATLTGDRASVRVLTGLFEGKEAVVAEVQPFTLVFDPDARRAFVRHEMFPVTTADGKTFRLEGVLALQTTPDEASVRYSGFVFGIDGTKLFGGANSEATTWQDFEHTSVVNLGPRILAGGPDVTPPHVWWFTTGEIEPLLGFGLFASEALLPSSVARLVGSQGDSVTFTPSFGHTAGAAVAIWENPMVSLRYGSTYHLDPATMVDFAGHQLAPFEIKTVALPPVIAPDGFETAPLGPLGGGEVVGAQKLPPVAGSRSLFIQAPCKEATPRTRASIRVAVPVGAKALHVSYRSFSSADVVRVSGNGLMGFDGNRAPATPWQLDEANNSPRPTPLPSGATGYLTDLKFANLPLPAGVVLEVIVTMSPIAYFCPSSSVFSGVLIDDVYAD